MSQKYILIDVTTEYAHRTLYRIKALRDFGGVKTGDIGGWVESYDNLSQEGNCWIYDDAKVYHKATISDNAEIHGKAEIYDYAKIYQNASVWGKAELKKQLNLTSKMLATLIMCSMLYVTKKFRT